MNHSGPELDTRDRLLFWGLLSALLMFGSLGPWLGVRFSADEGGRQGHGWLVLLAAVVGAVSLVVQGFAQVGWGLDFAIAGSLSLAVCGLAWLLVLTDSPERARTASALPPAG
jgi:hypothetical protein